ncbi:hypothetical protein ACMD2_04286 [Ananas comosus]|uniref:Uncharacterized protein n=1 Tax=Ananas comosus TaxID=4615 RepID=A0A199UEI3_ANACO|nr:hypothetical protein ACMD2_04286 [Ananas comosus]
MAATWVERSVVLSHVLTHPTPTPCLHSQLLVASRVPCFLRWEYPPFLCSDSDSDSTGLLLLRWCVGSLFLPRAAALGLARSSWRCQCPFQQPPPLRLSAAVDPPPDRWTSAERRAYLRRLRLRRRRLRPSASASPRSSSSPPPTSPSSPSSSGNPSPSSAASPPPQNPRNQNQTKSIVIPSRT